MILTTSNNIEGRVIQKYLGIISGESALGTGFLSSFNASLSDFMGSDSSMYSDKLKSARELALNRLIRNATNIHADAVIAIDIETMSLRNDVMGIICTGTAVKLSSQSDEKAYEEIPFKIVPSNEIIKHGANFGQMGRLIRTEGALVSVSSVRSTAPWVPSAGTIRHAC